MEAGTPIRFIASLIAATASLSACARRQVERDGGGDEQPLVVDRERRVARARSRVTALSGTMVSALVLTAAPVEAVPLPVLPIELSARLRAASAPPMAAALRGPPTVSIR